jgi:tetratricopeptide (TPR) repeat protein
MIRGLMAATSGDYPAAAEMYHRSLDLCKEIEDQWLEVITTSWLGDIAMYEDDNDRALILYNQSIRLAREQGDPWVLSPSLMSSGQIAIVRGDLVNAHSILLEVEALLRQTCDHWSLTWALNDLGHITLREGTLDQAAAYFLEAINLARVMGNLRAFIILLAGSAALIVSRLNEHQDDQSLVSSDLTTAGRLCGATESYIGNPGIFGWYDSKMLYDADISQVRSSMDEDSWDKAYSEGQRMPLEEAVELAVQSLSKNSIS